MIYLGIFIVCIILIGVLSSAETWTHVIAVGVDILSAAIIWRQYDITVSSLTGLALRQPHPALWARILGGALDHLQANHCELAIIADTQRAVAALDTLGHKVELS